MGIKITYKKKTPLSNEPQTTLKSAGKEQGKTKQDDTANQGPVPFIDKISVVMDVPAEMRHDSFISVMTQTKDYELFKSSKRQPPFNRAWRIVINCIPNAMKWPVLSASFDMSKQQALKFRVEFSPVDIRVWTQFAQHLNANIFSIERKAVAVFSNLVASLRISFILQKKRSTMLRIA